MIDFLVRSVRFSVPEDITVRQVELLSELFADERKTILEDLLGQADAQNDIMMAARITVTLGDIMSRLQAKGKLAYFLAVMTVSDADMPLREREEILKDASYKSAEKVLSFFFTENIFSSLFIPSYLITTMAGSEGSVSAHGSDSSTPSAKDASKPSKESEK